MLPISGLACCCHGNGASRARHPPATPCSTECAQLCIAKMATIERNARQELGTRNKTICVLAPSISLKGEKQATSDQTHAQTSNGCVSRGTSLFLPRSLYLLLSSTSSFPFFSLHLLLLHVLVPLTCPSPLASHIESQALVPLSRTSLTLSLLPFALLSCSRSLFHRTCVCACL